MSPDPSRELHQIDIDKIRPNAAQPRQEFDQEPLEELARSLKRQGVLQPVVVRDAGNGVYELIAGERRWRAAQIAGLMKMPAIVREIRDDQMLEYALIENIQREELNPIEAAEAFRTLIDDLDLTQQEVAQRVGKQRSSVANMLRLLTLPKVVQDLIRAGTISLGHAKVLASLPSPKLQAEIAGRIAKEALSVRQVEDLVKRLTDPPTQTKARPKAVDPNITAATEELQRAIGTKVNIVQGKKGGRIELHFFSDEEMQRVYQIVLDAARTSP